MAEWSLSVQKLNRRPWAAEWASSFYEGASEALAEAVKLASNHLSPLHGLNANFYHVALSNSDCRDYFGIYGPVEENVAQALKAVADRGAAQSYDALLKISSIYSAKAAGVVDCSYQDLKAKIEEKSVAQTSPNFSEEAPVTCYASMITVDIDGKNTTSIAHLIKSAGFQFQKWALPEGPESGRLGLKRHISRLEKIRKAAGDGTCLMAEISERWSPAYARSFVAQATDVGVHWIEDPFPANQKAAYLKWNRESMPICVGENFSSFEEFSPFIESTTPYVIQPDIVNCGGYTVAQKIKDAGERAGKIIALHGRRLFPALHLATSGPERDKILLEYNPIFEPERQAYMGQKLIPQNGKIEFKKKHWIGLWQVEC